MSRVFLCGHTGSENRGCNAIISSTGLILRKKGISQIVTYTFNKGYDEKLGLASITDLISYPSKPHYLRAVSFLSKKILKNDILGSKFLYKNLFKQASPDDLILNVGGDTYCYRTPYLSYELNRLALSRKVPTVFWGCSIDERILGDSRMQQDINKYTYIVARESLSYRIFSKCVEDSSKLLLACDPAFLLKPEKTELPHAMIEKNIVGINLSPLVFADYRNINDIMYRNVLCLIHYILSETNMQICLIPHVYDEPTNPQDLAVLRTIYENYQENDRVCLITQKLNAQQLKFIISKCRFFIGARTHAMIAAYSSYVPALALSYSVKSLGIAQDIFGTYEKYAVPHGDLKKVSDLTEIFQEVLINGERKMQGVYERILPDYTTRIIRAVEKVLAPKEG